MLSALTLGMPKMDQLLDNLGDKPKKRYMHHYNMPPHANGETGRVGSPKRREIGHGLLAERALLPVVPSLEEWAYTLRVVSEVLSSNGSTSMGSVCGSTLALMDGGVPIKAPVAGIAMGLIYDGGKYTTLTDILGTEDAFGDMDFKVAGTSDFVTALQLDTKIDGLPADVLAQALQQAKEARLAILDIMQKAIAEPRAEVGETAPKVVSFEIPIDKIGEVIGPKGKVINAIQAETGADISVDDDGMVGTVTIGSVDKGDDRRGRAADQAHPQPAHRRRRRRVPRPGREHHQVRCVREHPPGPRRPAPHLQDRWRQAHRQGGGRLQPRRRGRGEGRRRRPATARCRLSLASAVEIPDSAVSSGGGGRGRVTAVPATVRRAATRRRPRPAAPRSCPSRTASTPRSREEFGDLGPAATERWRPRRRAPGRRPWSPRRRSSLARPSMTDLLDPGVEQTELPNGLRIVTETMPEARSVTPRRLGPRRRARRARRAVGRVALPRAPAVQGHRAALGPRRSPRPSTPSAAR